MKFKAFEKIPREDPFTVTITEKINGTNACIVIEDNDIVTIQSRKRFITPENDNFGFASWVEGNKDELLKLGDGHHYGEWAGPGIQKNHHNLDKKTFFLFNTFKWNSENPNKPDCVSIVPVLYIGELNPATIEIHLQVLKDNAPEGVTPEGIVVYYHAFRKYTKHTIISPNGKWCKE